MEGSNAKRAFDSGWNERLIRQPDRAMQRPGSRCCSGQFDSALEFPPSRLRMESLADRNFLEHARLARACGSRQVARISDLTRYRYRQPRDLRACDQELSQEADRRVCLPIVLCAIVSTVRQLGYPLPVGEQRG